MVSEVFWLVVAVFAVLAVAFKALPVQRQVQTEVTMNKFKKCHTGMTALPASSTATSAKVPATSAALVSARPLCVAL